MGGPYKKGYSVSGSISGSPLRNHHVGVPEKVQVEKTMEIEAT